MKRPVAVIGFTYLIALLVASFLPEGSGWILAVAGLGLGIGMIFFRKSAFAAFLCAVFLTSGIAFAVYGGLRIGYVKQFERLDGETAVVQGEILEVEYSDGATELLLRVKEHSLEQAPSSFSLLVTGIEKEFYEVGDLFKTQVTLQSVSSHNSFSRTLHLRARGVFLTALLDSPVEIRENPSPSIQSQVTRISETLSSSLRRLLPGEPGALTAAIALGDRENLSEESVDGFQLCGVSHLLALSGLHLSLLCGVVLLGLERFAIHRKICYTVLILVVLLYMGLTGFGFSILRAGVMQILSYIAMICYRKADPLTSLGFAAGTICLFQPYAAGDVGLLLSVATTAAIIVFPGGWQRSFLTCCEQKRGLFRFSALRKGLSRLVPSLFVSFAAAIASFPVSVICFESFSLAGPFATLVYAPFLPVIMLGGLAAAIFQTLGLSFLAVPFALIAKWCAQLLLWCTEKLSGIPFVSLFLGEPYVVCWTVLVLAGGVLFLFFYRRGLSRFLAGSLSVLLTAAIVCQLYTMDVVKVRLVQGREENGVVVSLHGQALYFGSVSSGSDLYDLELALKQDHLSGACVLRPVKTSAADKWNVFLKNAAPEWTACLAGQDTGSLRWEPDYLLAEGDFMFSDQSRLEIRKVGEGYACLLRLQRMEILILTGGGDAADLPVGWTKPALLISLGSIENLSVLRPEGVLILGEEQRVVRRREFLACGSRLLGEDWKREALVEYQFRYGDDPVVRSVSLISSQ